MEFIKRGSFSGEGNFSGIVPVISANNGLTETASDVVQLGGTLIKDTTITTGAFQFNLGTVTGGIWNGTTIAGQYGGTGVANIGKTITLAGNITTTGAFNTTFAQQASITATLPPISTTLAGMTGTMASTYIGYWNDANQLTGANNLIWDPAGNTNLGFFGAGTNAETEVATDVNGLNPVTYSYVSNFNFNKNGATIFKFGNKQNGTATSTRIYIGDGDHAQLGTWQIFGRNYTGGDVPAGTLALSGGSGINHFMIYNDGGGSGSPNIYGNIEMSTINTISTGLTGLVISGKAATQDYIGMGTLSPLADLHIQKSKASSVFAVIENTQVGVSAAALMRVKNDQGDVGDIFLPSSTYTTSGAFQSRALLLYSSGTNGLNICSNNSSGIKFYLGGFASGNLTSNINSSGRWFFGGSTSATALVHLAAGTATANTAPLKFTSGTNLTTGETGAMEYDGTNLFFTRIGTTRESVMCSNSVNVVSPTAPNRTISVVIAGTTYYIAAKTTND